MPTIYKNNGSGKIYEILADETTDAQVSFRAIGNGGNRFKLTRVVFGQKYTALGDRHNELVERFRIELETYSEEVNISFLGTLLGKLAGPSLTEAMSEIDEIFAECNSGPGQLIRPTHDFSRVALEPSIRSEVDAIVASIMLRRQINAEFHLDEICVGRRSVYCFYGKPGTGKTLTGHAVAKKLGKLLYYVDYTEVSSASARREIFRRAKRYNAILFLDEADSLCASRTFWPSATAQQLNVAKNVFIQTLETYDGPVIMSTNLLTHFDEALMRRISRSVRFDMPSATLRRELFSLHLPPNHPRIDINLGEVAAASDTLSGGDIQNVCFNAIDSACVSTSPARWQVTTDYFIREIQKIKQAKIDNLAGNQATARNHPVAVATNGEE